METLEAPASLIGRKIGSIAIRSLLAEGGMGRVYVGYDERLQREVALKAVRPDRWSPSSRSRLLSEARVLSRLNHPHICAIHGYLPGEESDFLVLERIHGKTLLEALDEDALDPRSRMEVAEQIASALMAAHTQGIIHRDLKPANVMLTFDSGVKVLDFGIARRATSSEDETHPGFVVEQEDPSSTSPGNVVGTAEWMSPEQAKGEPLTAASDMYSFGLLLQQLFTGRSPYEPGLTSVDVLRRAQKGQSRPIEGLGKALTSLIERLKSLAPQDRPLAAEVQRFLRRVREAPRRRTRRLAAAAAALAAILGASKYTVDLQRQNHAALQARQEMELARKQEAETTAFLMEVFKVSDPGEIRGNTVTARELLDREAGKIRGSLRNQPLSQARMLDIIGQVYFRLGLYIQARPLLQDSLALRQRYSAGPVPLADSHEHLGLLSQAQSRPDAESHLREALALRRESLGPRHPDVGRTLKGLGVLAATRGQLTEAEAAFQQALEIQEASLGRVHPEVAATLNNLAGVWIAQGYPERAEPLLLRGLAIRESTLPPGHPDFAANLEALACLYQDRPRQAVPLHRRALAIAERTLGPSHPRTLLIVTNLGGDLVSLGQWHEAEALLKRSVEAREAVLGPAHPDLASSLGLLADLYRDQHRFTEAAPLYRQALAIYEAAYPPDHPRLAALRESYADMQTQESGGEIALALR
jgi:tetratricopeptide (TPR) repeat protein/predicted Ser/Thr protein kinase